MKTWIIILLLVIVAALLVFKRRSEFTPNCWRSCCSKETVQGASGPESVPNMDCLKATSLSEYCVYPQSQAAVVTGTGWTTDSDGNTMMADITENINLQKVRNDPGCASDPVWLSIASGTRKPWVTANQCGVYVAQRSLEDGTIFPASFDTKEHYCYYVNNADPCCTLDLYPGGPTAGEAQAARQAAWAASVQRDRDSQNAVFQANKDSFIGKGCYANADANGRMNFNSYCGEGCDAGFQSDPCCAERNRYAASQTCIDERAASAPPDYS